MGNVGDKFRDRLMIGAKPNSADTAHTFIKRSSVRQTEKTPIPIQALRRDRGPEDDGQCRRHDKEERRTKEYAIKVQQIPFEGLFRLEHPEAS